MWQYDGSNRRRQYIYIYIYIYTLKMENKKQLNKQPNNFHKLENKKRKI